METMLGVNPQMPLLWSCLRCIVRVWDLVSVQVEPVSEEGPFFQGFLVEISDLMAE